MLVAIVLAVLVVGGAAAAAAVKLLKHDTAASSTNGTAAQLLPASTVLYATFNPNPTGTQGTNLQTIKNAFTGQPGFAAVENMLNGQLHTGCIDTNKQLNSWIGGPVAIALTDPAALDSAGSNRKAAENAVVGVVGLKVKLSITDILSQNKLGSANGSGSYNGIALYKITINPGCGGSSTATTPLYAAMLNGYAVVGASQASVEREIDVYQGKAAKLSDSATYKKLAAKIATDGLAFVYIDTAALVKHASSASTQALGSLSGTLNKNKSTVHDLTNNLGPSGIALTAQPNGLDLQGVALTNSPLPNAGSVTANKGADALPDGSIFYLSADNLKGLITNVSDTLKSSGAVDKQSLAQVTTVFGNVLNLMDGEFAMGVLPLDVSAVSHIGLQDTSSLPFMLMFDVAKHSDAAATIQQTLTAFGGGGGPLAFTAGKTGHGNDLYSSQAGYGYALIKQWLVVSTSIKDVAKALENVLYGSGPSLSAGSTYKLALGNTGGKKTSVMYLDIEQLRTTLEKTLLSSASPSDQKQYRQAQPLLVPMRALEFSTASEDGGTTTRADMFLVITK